MVGKATTTDITALESQRVLAISALIALAFGSALFTAEAPVARFAPAVAGAVLAGVGFARTGPGAGIAIVAFVFEALMSLGLQWDIVMVAALAALFVSGRFRKGLPSVEVPRGSVPSWPTFFCGAVTPVFLVGWVVFFKPHVSDIAALIPNLPVGLLVVGAVAFAIANALLEEGIWRGVFQTCLSEIFPVPAAIGIQAVSFGILHTHGFPRGLVGIGLAGTWGGMLGLLRKHSRGLLAPVLAHFVADATIAVIMIFWLR